MEGRILGSNLPYKMYCNTHLDIILRNIKANESRRGLVFPKHTAVYLLIFSRCTQITFFYYFA